MITRKLATIAAILGGIAAVAIMYIALQHNPQCEFECDGAIDWSHLLMYGGVAFLQVFAFVICLALFVKAIKNL
ncbi:hypothetical protein ACFSJ3_00930 [Corallincola platygyrae]|uniref:Disulfide bond formation protein B n=1 Tax=Corallincola platygyrae TaxID=1193278 RepID=A0ABW4XKM2_9GAMM